MTSSVETTEPRLRHEMFVADVRGVELAFQVYHLHDQLFAYIGRETISFEIGKVDRDERQHARGRGGAPG